MNALHLLLAVYVISTTPQDILDELTNKRAIVVNADDESKWMLRISKDSALKRDLNDDVTKANSSLDDLEETLREKKNKLQRLVVDDEARENAYETLVDLLAPLEFKLQQQRHFSLDRQDIAQRSQSQKVPLV